MHFHNFALIFNFRDTLPPTKKLSKEQVLQAHKEIVKYLTNNDEFFNTVAKYMVKLDNAMNYELTK